MQNADWQITTFSSLQHKQDELRVTFDTEDKTLRPSSDRRYEKNNRTEAFSWHPHTHALTHNNAC